MYGFVSAAPLVRPSASASTFVSRRSAAPASAPAAFRPVTMAAGLDKSKIPMNLFRPNAPLQAKVIYNEKIVGDEAPGETNHMVFNHDGALRYLEGQSIGVMAPGVDEKGKPHKIRLYSIASSAHGDFGDDKTISLVVKRLVYDDEEGKEVKGVCSNHLCDLKPGEDVALSGPVGTAMLMPTDPNATIIMLATGTGIAPFRAFMRRAFAENNPDYQFTGTMWLFLGVPTSDTLLYQEEFEEMKANFPDNVRLDWAISREQKSKDGGKMYIQTRMSEYTDELYELLKKDNTYVYMCGLKGMESGIDDFLGDRYAVDGLDWKQTKRELKKAKRYEVEVYVRRSFLCRPALVPFLTSSFARPPLWLCVQRNFYLTFHLLYFLPTIALLCVHSCSRSSVWSFYSRPSRRNLLSTCSQSCLRTLPRDVVFHLRLFRRCIGSINLSLLILFLVHVQQFIALTCSLGVTETGARCFVLLCFFKRYRRFSAARFLYFTLDFLCPSPPHPFPCPLCPKGQEDDTKKLYRSTAPPRQPESMLLYRDKNVPVCGSCF